jgi:PPOX class probable F420-dependent enzyme
LVAHARVGRLGLIDDAGRPRVLPVTYAVHGAAIWSAVDRKPKRPGEPARLRWLRRRPDTALTVDRYSDDWDELAWLQVLGRVELLAAADAPDAIAALAAKYAPYRVEPPPGPLLRLAPQRLVCWQASPL